jgi:hypothetical protein
MIHLQHYKGGCLKSFMQHCFICRPSYCTVSEDARIEHRAFQRLHGESDAVTARPDLIKGAQV